MRINRSKEAAGALGFLIELMVYAVFVAIYFFLVLHFLGGWLKWLFDVHRGVYAVVALGLITAQGVLLQWLTAWLLAVTRGRAK